MSKAEEYYNQIDVYSLDNKHKTAKTMNHKTLEDIKLEVMLKSKYIEYRGVMVYMKDLDEILETMKL